MTASSPGQWLRQLAEKATPGPWEIDPEAAAVFAPGGRRAICSTWNVGDEGERMYGANRALIALAPELARLAADMADQLAELLQHPDHVSDEVRKERNRHSLDLLARFAALAGFGEAEPHRPSGRAGTEEQDTEHDPWTMEE